MKNWKIVLVLGLIGGAVACGVGEGGFGVPYSIESYNMNGTKLIVNGLVNQTEPATYDQDQYTLKTDQRLLIRFESLNDHVNDIKNSWDNSLYLMIVPTNGTDPEVLKKSVKLCPMAKNWMMLATWYKAHPFNKEGRWTNPGGDFDSTGCLTGEVQNPDGTDPDATPSPSPSATPSGHLQALHPSPTPYLDHPRGIVDRPCLVFDIRHWFESNPVGRNLNFGFIIISSQVVDIFGDKSDAYSPRLYWKMPKSYDSSKPDVHNHGFIRF